MSLQDHCLKHPRLKSHRLFSRIFILLAGFFLGGCLIAVGGAQESSPPLWVYDLRTEYLEEPLGIDAAEPHLSWKLRSDGRGKRQSAYQVLVASTPKLLNEKEADLWDSGKVESDRTAQVAYRGKPLTSRQRCHWKVRVWDENGRASQWSPAAFWSMGLLEEESGPSPWQARWIGKDEPQDSDETSLSLEGAQWIWGAVPVQGELDAAVGSAFFRKEFTVPEGKIETAALAFAGDNHTDLWLNGEKLARMTNFKQAKQIDVTEKLASGKNVLAAKVANVGSAPNPAGLVGVLRIELAGKPTVTIRTDDSWKATTEASADFEKRPFNDDDWNPARLVAVYGAGPWNEVEISRGGKPPLPARHLRKEFQTLRRPIRHATASICGLGYYELYCNGEKVGDHVLDPILTYYDKRVPYVTYDVTSHLKKGANALGILLGNGRYYAPRLTEPTKTLDFGFPKVCCQVEIVYDDGSTEVIATDPSWKLTTEGPIRANNDYDGEIYDARKELEGWAVAGFDDADWQNAEPVEAPPGKRTAQMMPPMRVTEHLEPVDMHRTEDGRWIFDMGQNLVGWCRLKVKAPEGTTLKLRHAETLTDQGELYTANLRGAKCRDIYITSGRGQEVYEPRFTYHGFRYVELSGYPGKPDPSTLTACVVHTDLPFVGKFTCNKPLVNRIVRNIFWGTRGNYLSIPTDCPQRDERQGWQGDRAAESKGEMFLFDNITLYKKWLIDIEDSQTPEGNLSDVCPPFWPLYRPNVTWPSAFTIIPTSLYLQYGDREPIGRHYGAMKKWMEHHAQFIDEEGLIHIDNYGDWCVPPESPELIHSRDPARKTSKTVLATSYYIHNLDLLAKYARMLERPEEAKTFADRAARMRRDMNAQLFDAEKVLYDNGTQTSSVLPLRFDIVPPEHRERLEANLIENIEEVTDFHIGTGLIGGQWVNRVLTDAGRPDIPYRFVTNRDYPSWGYMVENGATTIWELWNGNTADPAMNSGNHVMLVGDLTIWLFESVAGIQSDAKKPGFAHLRMKPHPVGDLNQVDASFDSIRGPIESHWRRQGKTFTWSIQLPANTSATVFVPTPDPESVLESGSPAGGRKSVRAVGTEGIWSIFEIGSGKYTFETDQAKTIPLM